MSVRLPKPGSRRARMLEALRQGDKTTAELRRIAGYVGRHIAATAQGDLRTLERKGLCVCLSVGARSGESSLWTLSADAEAAMKRSGPAR